MKKILFITGSVHQTSQMHQIATELIEVDCWFSQVFADSKFIKFLVKNTRLLENTALSGQFRSSSEKYMRDHGLQMDHGARLNKYDLIVYCSDLLIPQRIRKHKTIWVQEGMVDKMTTISKLVKALRLPPALSANTSLNGSSNICDVYCAASDGYKHHFGKMGTDKNKIVVTGIPNYDNAAQYLDNDIPFQGYVMVATTDMRETFRSEDRPAFIKEAVKIAAGRRLLFKFHPNEDLDRAEAEVRQYAPKDTLVFRSGNTHHMIANCAELITQYSTVVFTGIALGKKVHSWFDVPTLHKLAPLQNGGTSAQNIAAVCQGYLDHTGDKKDFDPTLAMQHILIDEPVLEEYYAG